MFGKDATRTASSARLMKPAALLSVLALSGWGAWSAFAAAGPPTITSSPANPTTATAATFTYTSPSATGFRCRLDAAAFTTCPSAGRSFTGLAEGSHTFEVQALDKKGAAGSAASFSWVVDRTGPGAPAITTGPSGVVRSTTATFTISGESGARLQCALESPASPVACTSPVTFSGLSQGAHTLHVRQIDAAGNVGSAFASRSWTVDTVAPQAPVLRATPDDPNGDGIAVFDWTDADPSVDRYRCSLENKPSVPCASPLRTIVDVSNDGLHQFSVSAYDVAGNVSTTSYAWKVLKAVNVVVDGNAVGLLHPGGPARPIALKLHNPNNFPVTVASITVALRTSPAGCEGDTNLAIAQSDVGHGGATQTVTVAANSDRLVPDAHRPSIRLLETGRDQDACKNGSFGFSYVATGTK